MKHGLIVFVYRSNVVYSENQQTMNRFVV